MSETLRFSLGFIVAAGSLLLVERVEPQWADGYIVIIWLGVMFANRDGFVTFLTDVSKKLGG
jgi:hypothetical protein